MLLHIARGAAGALRLFRIGGGVLRRGSDLQVLLQIEAAVAHQCQISRAPAVVRSDSQLATSLHVHNYLATRFTLEGYKAELAACNTLASMHLRSAAAPQSRRHTRIDGERLFLYRHRTTG